MDGDDLPIVLPSATSGLSLALHPLPILNISEHLTRTTVQTKEPQTLVLGVLLGTQNGREVEIVNSFELPLSSTVEGAVDHDFLNSRREQYKQVFPSIDIIGWYSVAARPTASHIVLQEQFAVYSSTPLLVLLQPDAKVDTQLLPLKAYESTVEIRDRRSRTAFVEVAFEIETGEAERIAVDFTAKGNVQASSLTSHLSAQRAAVQMLHQRIQTLLQYVTSTMEGKSKRDHATLRALASLVASLPASENAAFRNEFDAEFSDVHLTNYLSALTSSTSTLNELVDKHLVYASVRSDERTMGGPRRRGMGMGMRTHEMMMDRFMS